MARQYREKRPGSPGPVQTPCTSTPSTPSARTIDSPLTPSPSTIAGGGLRPRARIAFSLLANLASESGQRNCVFTPRRRRLSAGGRAMHDNTHYLRILIGRIRNKLRDEHAPRASAHLVAPVAAPRPPARGDRRLPRSQAALAGRARRGERAVLSREARGRRNSARRRAHDGATSLALPFTTKAERRSRSAGRPRRERRRSALSGQPLHGGIDGRAGSGAAHRVRGPPAQPVPLARPRRARHPRARPHRLRHFAGRADRPQGGARSGASPRRSGRHLPRHHGRLPALARRDRARPGRSCDPT